MSQVVQNEASSRWLNLKNRGNVIAQLTEADPYDDSRSKMQYKTRVRTAPAGNQSLAEQFALSIVGEMLYARLFCGLRFFDKNHKMTGEFPPCAVKQVCSILAIAKSQGRTTEELLAEEVKLAANGLEKLQQAAPHAICVTCANGFCPIKKRI
jgi:hypothetical protein